MTGAARGGVPVVAVGASAGGLEALRELFNGYSGLPGLAFVVVQHLDPDHDSLMAQLLERYTAMTVTQAAGGEAIAPDHIYVIPPAHGLAIEDGVLRLTEFKDPRGLRRPIDDFFESLAAERAGRAACIILSGTGGDGSRGLRAIKELGGLALVQEPASARYDGMPVAAMATGLVDLVLPPGQMIEALRSFFDRADSIALDEAEAAGDHIDAMCQTLRDAVGHDFSGYKRSTLSRRIARRMQVIGVHTSDAYLARLRADPDECRALFRDLLINVTRFFRDTAEFARLRDAVIDPLVAESRDSAELRLWVAGCSSGEEAYSIAMLVAAAMHRHDRRPYVQIFATDIDETMLDIARAGTYPLAALSDIPAEFHAGFVQTGTDSFTIAPRIRDMVRFSPHNLVRDPPYSKVDLISCRNLLIYFDEALQRQVLPAFHFALNPGGRLFLGSSESIGRFDDLFAVVDRKARLFERRETAIRHPLSFAPPPQRGQFSPAAPPAPPPRARSAELAALTRLADRHAPVSLLVDADGLLLNQWGAVGRYLDFPDRGDPHVNAVRQAKPGLGALLGPMLRDVARSGTARIARDVAVTTDFGEQRLALLVEPVGTGAYLVVLRETGPLRTADPDDPAPYQRGDDELQYLQDELQGARLRLRTTVEELETTNEELKSSNEEMMSMNEELQSTNEELTTVNDELKAKIDQLSTANADLKNFFDSAEQAVLVVDGDLRLRSATGAAEALFAGAAALLGAPLATLPTQLSTRRYVDMAAQAAATGAVSDYQAMTQDGARQFAARVLPYRRIDGSLDGATLIFIDVTAALELENALAEERATLRMALDVAKIGVWEYEPATGRTRLDARERALLGISAQADGDMLEPILDRLPADDRERVTAALARAMDGQSIYDETFRVDLPDGAVRWLHGLGRLVDTGDTAKFIGVTYEVTAERELLAERELMLREMNHRVKNMFAVMTGLTKMSARHAESARDLADSLCDRIYALGRSHALTTDGLDGTTDLESLIAVVLGPAQGNTPFRLSGPAVPISARQVTSLALIFHEWATNSAKYGALSVADGQLSVAWTRDGDTVSLAWTETGGVGGGSGHTGFGTQLIAASARQLLGSASAAATDDGYARTLVFTLAP